MNELSKAIGDVLRQRVESGEWRIVAIAGEAALKPIAEFLREQYGVDTTKGHAIAVIEIKDGAKR